MSNESALRREVGAIALMFTGLGSIIGSGWLFGAWRAAQLAGPGAIYSWIIGAVIILFVALTYAELGAMFPESGGAVRYSQYSHGSLVGFVAGWSGWIAIVSVIPVEAEASVQYMSSWKWEWAHALYDHAANGQGVLTASGLSIAGVLVILYFLLNFWSVKVFAETNSAITFFKLIVPAATAITLMLTSFHWSNFRVGIHGGAHAGNLAAILTAVATSGIVFSYNGFQNPVNLAGEARNPGKSVPFAIFGAIGLSTVVYLLLQFAFLGSVAPESLSGGWASLEYSSPFAQLAIALNLNWLAILLYADAFVSPSGTGTTYTASTARLIYAMERNGTVPSILGRVHPRYGIPRPAMWFNLLVSFIFLFSYKGWSMLAAVISVATIITYLIVPISVVVLRTTAPHIHRPLRIPGLKVLSPLAFTLATLMLFWARWPNTGEIMLLLVLPMPVYFFYQAKNQWRGFDRALRAAWWLVGYLLAITVLSWAGSREFGGRGWIPYGWDQLAVAITSLFFYAWGVRSGWRTPDLDALEARSLRTEPTSTREA
ncbi:MAG TPA: APC family permease [Steroidobacteraceae bacterium]|jgi:amino acid transporter|nr:APC family permease [Steroidobacteraceae bacterium]